MRTRVLALVIAAVTVLGAAGCDSVQEGIDTARDAATDAQEAVGERARQVRFCVTVIDLLADVQARDIDAAAAAMDELVATAPAEVADAARTVRDGLQAARDGQESALTTDEFRSAVQELSTYARETCDPTS
jgi:methyl-accepting chemotaxis protein